MAKLTGLLGSALFDRCENIGDHFGARFCAEVTFAMHANADCVRFHVAFSDDEHRVDFHLFRALDFAVDFVGEKMRETTPRFARDLPQQRESSSKILL